MRSRLLLLALSLTTVFACVKRMIGYECVGLSGCNMAPRYSGTVTTAEWSSGEDAIFADWRWDVSVKINEGSAQCSGKYRSTRISRSDGGRIEWREEVTGSLAGKGKFSINVHQGDYDGFVQCPEGKGKLKHNDYIKKRTWSRNVTGLDSPNIHIEGHTTDPNKLSGSQPDTISGYDGAVPIYMKAAWELHGTQPCRTDSTSGPLILVRPEGISRGLPYTIDHSLNSQEIEALKAEERRTGRGNAGLTRAKPLLSIAMHTDTAPTRQRDGHCYWVDSVVARFPSASVHINRDYTPASCEYRETNNHEMRHVDAYATVFRNFMPKIRDTLVSTTRHYPAKEHPLPVVSVEALEGINNAFFEGLRDAITPIFKEMGDSLKLRHAELDSPEEEEIIYDRCNNW